MSSHVIIFESTLSSPTTKNSIKNLRYYYNFIRILNTLSLLLLLLLITIIVPLSTTETTTKIINYKRTVLFTPENIRFALNRCQNDSNLNLNQIWIWMPWRLSSLLNEKNRQNINAHCLIKCFLTKLGLINLKHRGLDDEKFLNQIYSKNFKHSMSNIDQNDANDSDNENELKSLLKGSLDGTCQSYHNKWTELMENYGQIIRKSFFGYKYDVRKFYQNNDSDTDKNVGKTSTEFCNKRILFNNNEYLPQINFNWHQSSSNLVINVYKCYLKCIFVHFHYFDAYGRIDINEVIRSVQEAEFMNSYNLGKIYFCVHTSNQLFLQGLCNVAYELYNCLLSNVYGAKNMIEYRNEITRYY